MSDQLKLNIEVKNKISDLIKQQLGDWECLYPFFEGTGWQETKTRLRNDIPSIVPDPEHWFRCFTLCKYSAIKVVFVGLCPYHTTDSHSKDMVADGLAFSTKYDNTVPPSLFKLYKGIEADLWNGMNLQMNRYNDLTFLAEQGILLFNAALTTIKGTAGYHNEVWKPFTSFLLTTLSKNTEGLIFVGFGQVANQALLKVDRSKHMVIELEHPAASAYQSRHWTHENAFSRINDQLSKQGKEMILWDNYLVNLEPAPF